MIKHSTWGEWFPTLDKVTDGAYRIEIFTNEGLNSLANLGTWAGGSIVEGVSDAILMANAKQMYHMLETISKYGASSGWIQEDVDFLLSSMEEQFDSEIRTQRILGKVTN